MSYASCKKKCNRYKENTVICGKFQWSTMSKSPFPKGKLWGATPKIINEIFTDGLTLPVFRDIVKDLGTTIIIATPIQMLPDIYSESEN